MPARASLAETAVAELPSSASAARSPLGLLDLAGLELVERGDQLLGPLLELALAAVLPEQLAAERRRAPSTSAPAIGQP